MKTSLSLTLLALFFIQTSFSQEINYKEVTEIILGEYHTEEDIVIIKEDIINNNKQKVIIKLLKTNKYLNKVVNINGYDIPESCSDFYIGKNKNNDMINKLKGEVLMLKKRYETINASSQQITKLNKKIDRYNALIIEQNEATKNFKMCIITRREIEKDFDIVIDNIYEAYRAKKAITVADLDTDTD